MNTTPPPVRPSSLSDTDWRRAIPDLPPVPEANGVPSFADNELDLGAIFSEATEMAGLSGPPSLTRLNELSGTDAMFESSSDGTDIVDLADLKIAPIDDSVQPAQGWYDSGVNLGRQPPAAPNASKRPPEPSDGGSDIFSGARKPRDSSDVLRTSDSAAGGSNIFDVSAAGSSRFSNPFEGTEEVRDVPSYRPPEPSGNIMDDFNAIFNQPAPSELFTDDDAKGLSGHFDDGSDAVNNLMDELHLPFGDEDSGLKTTSKSNPNSSIDFNETEADSFSSNLFDNIEDGMPGALASGVDLLNPNGNAAPYRSGRPAGQGSSIFTRNDKDNSKIDMDEIPLMGSSDEKTDAMDFTGPDKDGSANVFQGGGVSDDVFDLPKSRSRLVSLGSGSNQFSEEPTTPDEWSLGMPTPHRNPPSDTDSSPDLNALDDDIHSTQRIEGPSSGIFDVDFASQEEALAPQTDRLPPTGGSAPRIVPAPAPKALSKIKEPAARRTEKPSKVNPAEMSNSWLTEPEGKKESPKKSGKLGWIGGTAIGLLLGIGGTSGAYFAGLLPSSGNSMKSLVDTTKPVDKPLSTDLTDAMRFLSLGEPDRALPALEAAGEGAPPLVLAERGKARWLVRIRQFATTGKPFDPKDPAMMEAIGNLELILSSADQLKTPSERRALIDSALRLGLTKEMAGDNVGALKHYLDCAEKIPDGKAVFTTAANRIKAMQANSNPTAMNPRQAEDLAQVLVVALVMIQAEEVAVEGVDAEAGTIFWDAVNLATSHKYPEAMATLAKARKAHDQRRLALAGRGLNPNSDPLEQIFLRCCDDLQSYWKLKEEVHKHPVAGPIYVKSGLEAGLKALAGTGSVTVTPTPMTNPNPSSPDPKLVADLRNARTELGAKIRELDSLKESTANREKDYVTKIAQFEKQITTATNDAKLAKESQDAATKELVLAKMSLEDKAKEVTTAGDKLRAAQVEAKNANDVVNNVVAGLRANKLVGEKDDTATVLKNLPEVLKTLATSAESTDAKRAAEALTKARTDLDKAMLSVKTANENASKAEESLKTAMIETEKKIASVKADAEKQIATVQTESMTQIRKAQAETQSLKDSLAAERKKAAEEATKLVQKQIDEMKSGYETKIATLANDITKMTEEHRRQISNARQGIAVPLTSAELIAKEQAGRHFDEAVDLYFTSRHAEAEVLLTKATAQDANDARYWYYLGLVRLAQGKPSAVDAFQKGAENEGRNSPSFQDINTALERIQGPARRTLASYRP
ncbi:MAG: hypothetical protein ACRC8S_07405 [Fimbriiglobus sp.]